MEVLPRRNTPATVAKMYLLIQSVPVGHLLQVCYATRDP